MIACGTLYSWKLEPPCSSIYRWRAATIGSLGTAKGSLSIITHDSCSPRTSTPCQKLEVANRTACGVLRNLLSRAPFDALPCTKHGKSISGATRSNKSFIPDRLVDKTKARPSVALTILMTSCAAALAHCGDRGSGIWDGKYKTAWCSKSKIDSAIISSA